MLLIDYEQYRSHDGQFHYVYETVCLVNGKKYIGKHSTINIQDRYIGSGSRFKMALKKHGRHNFKQSILKFFPTSDDAFRYENELLFNVVGDRQYYNVKTRSLSITPIDRTLKFWTNGTEQVCSSSPPGPEWCSGKVGEKVFRFKSPSKVIHETRSMSHFCWLHNLHRSEMYLVAANKRRYHKGWRRAD